MVALAWAATAPALLPPSARAEVTCASPDHAGGDWPFLNHDHHNTRHQDRETVIGVAEAPSLAPVWKFSVADAGAEGGLHSTPIVAYGCVYVAASTVDTVVEEVVEPEPFAWRGSTVFALNADTGALVWRTRVNGFVLGLAAADGRIYALPSDSRAAGAPSGMPEPAGSHAIALDAFSGEMLWSSESLDVPDGKERAVINASPVVFPKPGDGLSSILFVPLSIGFGDGTRVPLYFLDTRTGEVIERFFALTDEEYAAGYGGAGIWTTAAFDATTSHLYAGTADSESHRRQHPHNNAILKIDADPRRPTFGSVVDAYAGTREQYDLPVPTDHPVCETLGASLTTDPSASAACLENDLDFGASPNLYVDGLGRTLVAALQKSGILHVVDTAEMEPAWTRLLSVPHQISNAATGTIDGATLYVRAFPDLAFAFERTAGSLEWISSTGTSTFAYQPLTLANGVIYTISDVGQLVVLDAESGRPLLSRPIHADAGVESCYGWGAGVAVARSTVYAPCDADRGLFLPGEPGALVAYRPLVSAAKNPRTSRAVPAGSNTRFARRNPRHR